MAQISDYRYDQVLTRVSVGYKNEGYIAEQLAPVIPVGKRNGTYYVFGSESFQPRQTDRAPAARAHEVDYDLTPREFSAQNHALIGKLSDEERSEAPRGFNPEPGLVETVTDGVMLGREKRVADKVRNVENVPNNITLAGSDQFSVTRSADGSISSTGDPFSVLEDGLMAVRRAVGVIPNVAVIPWDITRILRQHPSMTAQLADNERTIVTLQVLRELLEVDEVLVPRVQQDTSNAFTRQVNGADAPPLGDVSDVWGRDILLAYRERNAQTRSPSFSYTFRVRERGFDGNVNRWREEDRHADFMEVGYTETTELIAPYAGYLIKEAVAA